MGARKTAAFTKDWISGDIGKVSSSRRISKFEQVRVTRSEDLPQLMTTQEAASFLKRHPKTIEEYRKDGSLKFIKIKGRYFTTPEHIADYITTESNKK